MRSCHRELATKGNLGEAEGVSSYSLLCDFSLTSFASQVNLLQKEILDSLYFLCDLQ